MHGLEPASRPVLMNPIWHVQFRWATERAFDALFSGHLFRMPFRHQKFGGQGAHNRPQ
jgi:hypothetical protein